MIFIAVLHDSERKINVWLAEWLRVMKRDDVEVMYRYEQPVSVNRNALVNHFLEKTTHEWMLMIDADQVPKTDWLKMIEHNEKVIMALTTVMTPNGPMPLVMKKFDDKEIGWKALKIEDLDDRMRENGLLEVEGVGGGVLLIHRSVLEAIKPPWFEFQMTEKGLLKVSEDYDFSLKVKRAGFKLFVDTNAKAGHMKNVDCYDLNRLVYKIISAKSLKVETFGKDKDGTEVKKAEEFGGLKV